MTDARGNRPLLLLGCWLVGCTLFLTLARSKLFTYIWPVFPALAILAAVVWARKIDGALSDGAKRWMGRIVWCTCLIGPLGLPATFAVTQIALPTQFSFLPWTLAVVAALTSLLPLWSWRRGRDCLTLGLAARDCLRSIGRSAVLCPAPGCRGAVRPGFCRICQSPRGIARTGLYGPGAARLGHFLS